MAALAALQRALAALDGVDLGEVRILRPAQREALVRR